MYALGHAAVVVALGLLAIWFGTLLPDWVDGYMEKLAGLTLLLLGAWLIWTMARNRGRLVLRSRWMLVFDAAKVGYRRVLGKPALAPEDQKNASTVPALRYRSALYTASVRKPAPRHFFWLPRPGRHRHCQAASC